MYTDIKKFNRIVIKIGSSTILNKKNEIKGKWLFSLCEDIRFLQNNGVQVILVSSGSVAYGAKFIKKTSRKYMNIHQQQAAAAIGQLMLMQQYDEYNEIHWYKFHHSLLYVIYSFHVHNYVLHCLCQYKKQMLSFQWKI